jgi:HK97 family phage prohead protease
MKEINMLKRDVSSVLETKFCRFDDGVSVAADGVITGYASVFGLADQGGDVVEKGAYGESLIRLAKAGRGVKMLWQHDPGEPVGVWDEVREDATGLWVKGRILEAVRRGAEARALIEAGAIDGLSIGYRTLRATKDAKGHRLLQELDLWEVSLVTFPMLPEARVHGKAEGLAGPAQDMADAFADARRRLADLRERQVSPK